MDQETFFDQKVASCREKQERHRAMEFRTNLALYIMLAEAYELAVHIRADDALRAIFHRALAAQKMRSRSNNQILLLLEYLFFPHVLLRADKDNKPDIDKASRYATWLSEAVSANTDPKGFVQFAQKRKAPTSVNGTSKSDVTQSNAPGADHSKSPNATSVEMDRTDSADEIILQLRDEMFVGAVRFNTVNLAKQAAAAQRAANSVPLQITMTYITYPTELEKVITAMTIKRLHRRHPYAYPIVAPLEAIPIEVELDQDDG